jgi:hypothetical protein
MPTDRGLTDCVHDYDPSYRVLSLPLMDRASRSLCHDYCQVRSMVFLKISPPNISVLSGFIYLLSGTFKRSGMRLKLY